MSAVTPVPISAPWKTGWVQYPVQFYNFTGANPVISATAPEGQWWRPVWARASLTTDATVQTRGLWFLLDPPTTAGQLSIPVSGTFPASKTIIASAWAGATAYTVSPSTTETDFVLSYPDMIWPPGTIFAWQMSNPHAGDAFSLTNSLIAVEVYTEKYNAQGQPELVPTPLLA
jgi:hypothetical protein